MKFRLTLLTFMLLAMFRLSNSQDDNDIVVWQPPSEPQNPNYLYCHPKRPNKCQSQSSDTVQDFVCGIRKTGVPKTYHDSCRACKDTSVFAFLPGSCESQISNCPNKRTDCDTSTGQPTDSCAFQSSYPPVNITNNRCCKKTSYSQVMTGTCPILPETKCADVPVLISVLESCPYLYVSRVCAKKSDGKKTTFENYCWACKDRDTVSYTIGPCP